jgi:hypothetical protein
VRCLILMFEIGFRFVPLPLISLAGGLLGNIFAIIFFLRAQRGSMALATRQFAVFGWSKMHLSAPLLSC